MYPAMRPELTDVYKRQEQHRPFQEIRGAPQKGSRILWKGAGHLPDGSRDKWQNDVKKADGRGFFSSFWLHL